MIRRTLGWLAGVAVQVALFVVAALVVLYANPAVGWLCGDGP